MIEPNIKNMIKKLFLISIHTLFIAFIFISCDKDEVESLENHPSYRDGVYDGKNLTVTLNGNEAPTVTSVSVKSTLLDPNVDTDRDPNHVVGSSNPTYNSTIIVYGFPTVDTASTLETISDLRGFKGTATIQNITYEYVGEFTGDPLTTHDKQGLILQFTTK